MIYFLRNPRNGLIKIGCTTRPMIRFHEHVGVHGTLEILGAMEGGKDTELQIHRAFKEYKVQGSTWTAIEWYYPNDELIGYVTANSDLPIEETWRTLLSTPVTRHRKEPYKNRRLFSLLVEKLYEEGRRTSIPTASELSGVPAHLIRRLLDAKVKYMTKVNMPYYQRFADWLKCGIGDLIEYVPDAGEREHA